MIIGLGCDLVDIRRIEKLLKKYGQSFINRFFAKDEALIDVRNKISANFYAKRFAAKEAFVKALGIGFRHGIKLSDIQLLNNEYGKPYFAFSPIINEHLAKLADVNGTGNAKTSKIHVSLSDEYPFAQAVVIIEL